MRPRTKVLVAAAATVFTAVGFASSAGAGGEPTGAELDDATIEAVGDLIPDAPPEEDLDVASSTALYDEFVAVVGEDAGGGSGSSLTGPCGGYALSYGPDGLIDAAIDTGGPGPPLDLLDGGTAFTSSNRFKVDTDGQVVWFGFMPREGDGPADHEWVLNVGGVKVDSGGAENSEKDNDGSGVVDIGDDLPFALNANTNVDGNLTPADGEACAGNGHLAIQGPLFGPLGLVGLGLAASGAAGVGFGARPTIKEP